MKHPFRTAGELPLVDIPPKKKIDWNKYRAILLNVLFVIISVFLSGILVRACYIDEAKDKRLDAQCKSMGSIDMRTCRECLDNSSIINDPRCGSVNRWNAK